MENDSLFSGGGSDDGTFVPFTDILFNALLGFTVMVFIAFALIKEEAKTGSVELKAEMLITVTWPDNNPDDIDTYVMDPAGNVVWYHSLAAGLVTLDRDDRGNYLDTIKVDGKEVQFPLNQETVTIRGTIPGEYVINVYEFTNDSKQPVPVTVKVEKINPKLKVIYYDTINLTHEGDEKTVVRFTIDSDGEVSDINTRPISLIREVRK
ncbi:hypothetical protein [Paradevosia shaoguanensis]|jgi:hypothetical protein|uniref:Uncharacterized protein n=1 Tax=Paradevosia shaoguanensis TaxID=1335043 RepID=A0AA41UAZ2_9HYPH|nr:hypothetical protein [Paradevosia shaoguanensis]KFL26453.1 hypothetical protein JP74_13920 [Devosia sp. 17-2-E-8]MBI4047588.1 hypothetical protein [Devosia nanyangense]QMV02273.1 hypothetical protein GHV40_12620 [Devosia sp. D6-9]CDP54273.1 hypothetical protein [Devosia sp. DBB001]MCF1742352.1 hypothetical protein [Paradevosia shaoguanensis]